MTLERYGVLLVNPRITFSDGTPLGEWGAVAALPARLWVG